jgi:hypothetical protein
LAEFQVHGKVKTVLDNVVAVHLDAVADEAKGEEEAKRKTGEKEGGGEREPRKGQPGAR